MVKVWLIRGTVQRQGRRHVRIYVHADTAGDLINYAGRTVIGILILAEEK
jgi:hypothetical protein